MFHWSHHLKVCLALSSALRASGSLLPPSALSCQPHCSTSHGYTETMEGLWDQRECASRDSAGVLLGVAFFPLFARFCYRQKLLAFYNSVPK